MARMFFIKAIMIICSLLAAAGAFAIKLGDIGKVCLFSAMSGTITLNGIPVTNARLVRTGDRDGPIVDETFTDENGYFEFPPMLERTITKLLPQEFVASQKIIVHYHDKKYEMWSSVKRAPEENTESRGKALVVTCELNAEQTFIVINRVPIHSLCSWDVETDPKINWEEEGFFDH